MAKAIDSIAGGDPAVVVNSGSAWKYSITQKEHENITVNVGHKLVGNNTSGYRTKLIFSPAVSSNYGYNAGTIRKTADEKNHIANFTVDDATEVDGLLKDGWAGIYILNSNPNKDSFSYYFNDYNNHSSSRVGAGTSIENLLILGYYTEDSNGSLVAKTKYNMATLGPSNRGSLETYQNKYATGVKANGFSDCTRLTSVDIPNATSIGDYAFSGCTHLASVDLLNATSIGSQAFSGCTALKTANISNATDIGAGTFASCPALTSIDLPNATSIGSQAFYSCLALTSVNLPNAASIGDAAFNSCYALETVDLPNATSIGTSAFQNCSVLKSIDLPKVTSIGTSAFYAANYLEKIFLRSKTMCTCTGSQLFTPTVVIYAPESLIDSYKTATYWSNYASHFKPLESIKLTKISIIGGSNINTYNGNTTSTYKAQYNDGLVDPEQVGVTWSITGNATISQDGVVTLKNASVGDKLTITATSTYDTSISTSLTVSVVNVATSMTVDLNNGQWVDSGTTIDGHTVYKSDAGSYHVNNGSSLCTVTVKGYNKVTVYVRSYAEGNYDYVDVGPLDGTVTRSNEAVPSVLTTRGRQSDTQYYSHTFEINDDNTHTFDVLYSKDSSGNNYDDRGYFYVVCE